MSLDNLNQVQSREYNGEHSGRFYSTALGTFLVNNSVTIVFSIICIIGIYYSNLPALFITSELVSRIARNMLLVMSLIIPIRAGMGLNFSIVIGAMAAQIGMFFMIDYNIVGIPGMFMAALITVPLALVFGILIGKVLNRCKGQEMIATMMLAFFAEGLYQLFFLFLMGGVIPVNDSSLALSAGVGIKNSLDLSGILGGVLDTILKISLPLFLMVSGVSLLIIIIFKVTSQVRSLQAMSSSSKTPLLVLIYPLGLLLAGIVIQLYLPVMKNVGVPVVTITIILLFYFTNEWILKTKMGQDFRAIGQSMKIAKTAGIDVNRTRIRAIVISTVLAALGQLVFLQNIGTINTYGSHTQVGLFSSAAILIGGASLNKANGKQAFLGLVLFHILFIVSPFAGNNLFGEPQIGEYFRVFIAYGVIGISLAIYAWQKNVHMKKGF